MKQCCKSYDFDLLVSMIIVICSLGNRLLNMLDESPLRPKTIAAHLILALSIATYVVPRK